MTPPLGKASRVRTRTSLLLIVVFTLGGLCGAGVYHLLAPKLQARPHPPGGFAPAPLDELNLTEEQRAKAAEIGARYQPQIDAIRHDVAPRLRAIHEQMSAELRLVLTPQQRKIQDERHSRHRPLRRPPSGKKPPFPPPHH